MLTHEKKNIKEMREKNSANLIENVMITVIMIAFSHPFRRFFFLSRLPVRYFSFSMKVSNASGGEKTSRIYYVKMG